MSIASAHVPIGASGNTGLASAQKVENPTKSWAIYSQLDSSNSVSYFTFIIEEGEQIYVQLFVTTREDEQSFVPKLVLMGPGLDSNDATPDYIETTGDVVLVEGERSDPSYESFGPSYYIEISKLQLNAPETGRYYLAVFSDTGPGHFGLAIGRQESFTFLETVLNPINVIEVHRWQGQSWLIILLPYLMTFAVSITVYIRKLEFENISQKLVYFLGTLFASSSVSFTYQTVISASESHLGPEITISIIIVLIQSLIASAVLLSSRNEKLKADTTEQIKIVLLSGFAAFFWMGLVIGPVIGVAVGLNLIVMNVSK